MDRVHVPFDGPTLARIDREREKSNTSRAQWLSSAVVQYLAQLDQLKGQDPASLAHELAQQKITYEKLWRENQQLERAEKTAREDVDQARREIGPLKDQLASVTAELEQARIDMALLKRDMDHAKDTIGSRDKEIAFLEAHIANLVQSIGQLAIKPSEEEAKKKGWWQFWK
jgi:chromosome segregation ATPase